MPPRIPMPPIPCGTTLASAHLVVPRHAAEEKRDGSRAADEWGVCGGKAATAARRRRGQAWPRTMPMPMPPIPCATNRTPGRSLQHSLSSGHAAEENRGQLEGGR